MAKRRIHSREKIEKAVALYKEGKDYEQISTEIDMPYSTVARYVLMDKKGKLEEWLDTREFQGDSKTDNTNTKKEISVKQEKEQKLNVLEQTLDSVKDQLQNAALEFVDAHAKRIIDENAHLKKELKKHVQQKDKLREQLNEMELEKRGFRKEAKSIFSNFDE